MKKCHLPVYKLPKGYRLVPPRLDEAVANDPVSVWFDGFKNKYAEVLASWPSNLPQQSYDVFEKLYGEMFPPEIRGRMRLVGKGTTRIVFISDANVCYKFEYNAWRNQSVKELQEALAWPDLTCFPHLLDWSRDGLAMAFEVAEEPTLQEFVEVFTQTPTWIAGRLREYAEDGESRGLEMMLDSGVLNEAQAGVVRDLMKFQKRLWETQGRTVEDIDHADNWGKTYRDGQPVILVTDFGY